MMLGGSLGVSIVQQDHVLDPVVAQAPAEHLGDGRLAALARAADLDSDGVAHTGALTGGCQAREPVQRWLVPRALLVVDDIAVQVQHDLADGRGVEDLGLFFEGLDDVGVALEQ
jgi:hypothetical protein